MVSNKQHKKPATPLRQKVEENLYGALKEMREQHRRAQEDNERLRKELTETRRKLKESENRYSSLCRESKMDKKELSSVKFKESVEKYLVRETFSFLRAEGYTFNYQVNKWQRKEHPERSQADTTLKNNSYEREQQEEEYAKG